MDLSNSRQDSDDADVEPTGAGVATAITDANGEPIDGVSKRCIGPCGQVKAHADLSKNKRCRYGVLAKCKKCHAAIKREHNRANPEKSRESSRNFRKRHPERKRASDKRWADAHPEAVRVKHGRWRTSDPDRFRAKNAKKRARDRKQPYDDRYLETIPPWEACEACGQSVTVNVGTGQAKADSGSHDCVVRGYSYIPFNVAKLCAPCNQGKGAFNSRDLLLRNPIVATWLAPAEQRAFKHLGLTAAQIEAYFRGEDPTAEEQQRALEHALRELDRTQQRSDDDDGTRNVLCDWDRSRSNHHHGIGAPLLQVGAAAAPGRQRVGGAGEAAGRVRRRGVHSSRGHRGGARAGLEEGPVMTEFVILVCAVALVFLLDTEE